MLGGGLFDLFSVNELINIYLFLKFSFYFGFICSSTIMLLPLVKVFNIPLTVTTCEQSPFVSKNWIMNSSNFVQFNPLHDTPPIAIVALNILYYRMLLWTHRKKNLKKC